MLSWLRADSLAVILQSTFECCTFFTLYGWMVDNCDFTHASCSVLALFRSREQSNIICFDDLCSAVNTMRGSKLRIHISFLVTKLINTTLLFFVILFQDDQIGEEKKHFKITGGCCVIVALFFLGKLYLANAGDSRFVLALVDLCNV